MSELPEVLTKKIGPLPAGVWLLAIGGGVAVAVVVRRGAATADEPDPEADASDWEQGGNTDTQPGSGNLGGGGTGGNDAPGNDPVTTNEEWFRRATDALVADGYSAAVVSAALNDYLYGQPLDTQERAIVDIAVRKVGSTPLPVPPAPNKPPPPTNPTAPKPPPRTVPPMPKPKPIPAPKPKPVYPVYHIVRKGETLGSIGRKYGKSHGWLYVRNKNVIEGWAKKNGKKSSLSGRIIYPGMPILVS